MKKYWPLGLIILVGVVLRFYHNTLISIWHDEAFSALLIRYPWNEMMYRIGLDVHPPMYYIILRFWSYVFGGSVLSLRGMSILFGTGTILAGYLFVKEIFKNEKAALWAALLIAINPFQLQNVTEARMYTMGAFFAVFSAYFLVKALRSQKQLHDDASQNMPNLPQDIHLKRRMIAYYLLYTVFTAIIILTHYYLLFTAAAIGFYGLIYLFFHHRWDYKKYVPLLLSFIVIATSFLPWLKTFLFQYRQVSAGYWIPKMNFWSIPSTLWQMLLGIGLDTTKTKTQIGLLIVTVFSIYFIYRFLRKTDYFEKWLILLAILAPFGGAMLFVLMAKIKGSTSSVYMDRYFLFASTFYTMALAVWLKEISIKKISTALFMILCLVNFFAFVNYWQQLNVKTKPGMSGVAKFLQTNVEPGQKIYVGSSFVFFNYKYYNQLVDPTPVKPLLYTGGRNIDQISHVEGSAILTQDDLVPNFSQATKPGDTVWLLWTVGFSSNKPEVPKNWVQIDEQGFNEVRPYPGAWDIVTEYKVN